MGSGAKPKAAEKVPCPECGRLLSNRGALTLHRRYQHGVGVVPGPGVPTQPTAEVTKQPDGRARMAEESVPLWKVELERERAERQRREEKLEEQLRALGVSLESLGQALPGVRQGVEAAAKGQEQVLSRIEALTQAVGTIGEDVKGVTALKAELKSLCDLYPDLCKVVEDRKAAPLAPPPPAPEAPPAPAKPGHPASPPAGQPMSIADAIEFLKHWTGCPECVERLRPELQKDPALLDDLLKVYRPEPKEAPHERRGFLG